MTIVSVTCTVSPFVWLNEPRLIASLVKKLLAAASVAKVIVPAVIVVPPTLVVMLNVPVTFAVIGDARPRIRLPDRFVAFSVNVSELVRVCVPVAFDSLKALIVPAPNTTACALPEPSCALMLELALIIEFTPLFGEPTANAEALNWLVNSPDILPPILAPLSLFRIPPPDVLVVAVTFVTRPEETVVAVVEPVSLRPLAVELAVACWPFAVLAVAEASAVPVVEPEPPVAVAVTFEVASIVALRLVVVPTAVAIALPPAPEIEPAPPAPPVARAVTVVV